MALSKRLLGAFLIATALAAVLNWIATPLYNDGGSEYGVWKILNWFMAVAVALVPGSKPSPQDRPGKRSARRSRYPPSTWRPTCRVYGSVALTGWFFWNWFHSFLPENEPELVGEIHLAAWVLINPLFVVVCAATGLYLFREAARD